MKKTSFLLSIVIFLFSFTGIGQFQKGDKMYGASLGNVFFNSGSANQKVTSIGSLSYKTTGFGINISPSIGWFLTEKTALGASLSINPTSQKTTYTSNNANFQMDKSNNFNIGLGGFVRNYFKSSGSFLPFGQIGFNAGLNNSKTEGYFYGGSGSGVYKETYDGISSGGFFVNSTFTLGLTKMLGEITGLDVFAGYNFSYNNNTFKTTRLRDDGINGSIETRAENETTTDFTNHGFVLGVGFQVFLRKKK
ncbi:MAG: hypothetical protein WBC06_13585 [Chitinophagaceae bacterium]